MNSIDDDLCPYVNDFAVCQICLILVQGLVDAIIHANPFAEVVGSDLGILANVIGTGKFHFSDIGHDQLFIVTFAFPIQRLNVLCIAAILDPSTTGFCAVSSVQNSDRIVRMTEPFAHVVDRGLGGCSS